MDVKIEDLLLLGAAGYLLVTLKGANAAPQETFTAPAITPSAITPSTPNTITPSAPTIPGSSFTPVQDPIPYFRVDLTPTPKSVVFQQPTTTTPKSAAPTAQTSTPQQISNQVQQSFGVKSTTTVNNIVIPVTKNQAQNTNNTLRALKGLPPV